MASIMENLREKIVVANELVKDTRLFYIEMKKHLKLAEDNLKRSKRNFNRAYDNWTRARVCLDKAKRKLSAYPSQTRRYAKEHMDKVFDLMEGKDGGGNIR